MFDGHGRRLSRSHTVKTGKRYRYYITHSSEDLSVAPPLRLPAYDIEKSVIGGLVQLLEDRSSIRRLVGSDDAARLSSALDLGQHTAGRLRSCTYHRRTKVATLVERVDVGDADIRVKLSRPVSASFCEATSLTIAPSHSRLLSAASARARK